MSALVSLIGEPFSKFPETNLPTVKDVSRFYTQYWGVRASDSQKQKLVADELMKLYQQKGIPVFSEKTIKTKIGKNVGEMKKILRFSSKPEKTIDNIVKESEFQWKLDEIFEITRNIQTEEFITDDTPMETDLNGIYFPRLIIVILLVILLEYLYPSRIKKILSHFLY